MILQALVRCYESLAAARKLEKPGWSMVKVSWGLELTPEGQIERLWPLELADEKGKKRPQLVKLPAQAKRAVGIIPKFLCDNSVTSLAAIIRAGRNVLWSASWLVPKSTGNF